MQKICAFCQWRSRYLSSQSQGLYQLWSFVQVALFSE